MTRGAFKQRTSRAKPPQNITLKERSCGECSYYKEEIDWCRLKQIHPQDGWCTETAVYVSTNRSTVANQGEGHTAARSGAE